MTAVPSLTTTGLKAVDHSAVTWNVPAVLAAWYFTVSEEEASAPSIVPSGHGPAGCVVPDQLHWAPLAPLTASSAMNQTADGAPGLPLTVACKVTSPLAGIVADIGETATVTLLGLDPLAPPQLAVNITDTSAQTHRALYQFIKNLSLEINERSRYTGRCRAEKSTTNVSGFQRRTYSEAHVTAALLLRPRQ